MGRHEKSLAVVVWESFISLSSVIGSLTKNIRRGRKEIVFFFLGSNLTEIVCEVHFIHENFLQTRPPLAKWSVKGSKQSGEGKEIAEADAVLSVIFTQIRNSELSPR